MAKSFDSKGPSKKDAKKAGKKSSSKKGSSKRTPAAAPAEDSPYAVALRLAGAAYAPSIRVARNQAMATEEQLNPGGRMDQAYEQARQAIMGAQAAAVKYGEDASARSKSMGEGMAQATSALGAGQVAAANEAMRLYGASGEAAKVAASQSGAAANSQMAHARTVGDVIAAQTGAAVGQAPMLTAANERARGDARTKLYAALQEQRGGLQDLRTKRGQLAAETATGMVKDQRDYDLAVATLTGKQDAQAQDYKLALAKIAEDARQADIADENTDLGRQSQETIAAGNNATSRANNAASNRARSQGTAGSSKGSAQISVGRDGRKLNVSPSTRTSQVQARNKVISDADRVYRALSDGKSSSAKEVQKRTGLRGAAWDVAWAMAQRRARTGKYQIPRNQLPYLKTRFYRGELPYDLANMVDRIR